MSTIYTELDVTRSLLSNLGFEMVPTILPELVERGVREELTMLKFLDLIMNSERDFREERRVRASLKLSGLPVGKTLETYDFSFQRSISRNKVDLLPVVNLPSAERISSSWVRPVLGKVTWRQAWA